MYINVVKTAFAFPQQWGLNEINKNKNIWLIYTVSALSVLIYVNTNMPRNLLQITPMDHIIRFEENVHTIRLKCIYSMLPTYKKPAHVSLSLLARKFQFNEHMHTKMCIDVHMWSVTCL
jgi:hypothetical protein